ncbi:uncharacterized protein LOC132379907 isoform X2 [Hypanus sabinus]|uniref:uncharacterized protein LOC132379907 isoform X2 n=1 Tax=Hypanus sabinus TaxID=79690 RepID=UPI0028C3F874|nr:uncharacterized protein LOC132379907 isoform X2 [Hypanus sabinus]
MNVAAFVMMSINRTLSWLLLRFYSWIPASARHYLFNWFPWFQKSSGYQSKHFVGLKNQGATCYLNTLLQTWFMTQEVKECITSYNGQDSLICELRSLFERLSNGNKWSLSTEQLTSQLKLKVYKQRDIEECFRSLVNKLNSKMDQEDNILKIYQVTMVNSLKCLKCKQSMDEDTFFLDIPLSVCSVNAAEKFDFMEKSLEQFLKEEKMEGDNKCYCTNCEMKTETSSRYYFKHLPQILTFQLKRFEFDYNYMAFQKITDCITVPPGLEFTRSQDVHNEWHVKFTVNKVNNAQNDSDVDVVKDEETPAQHQEVSRGDSVVLTGRNPETPQDHSQQGSTGQEVNNAQNDTPVDVVQDEGTTVQHQEVNREDSVVFTGRNPETPQDHSQQISTEQEVNDAQNDWHVDVVKDEETPVQTQEVKQEDSVDITGRNPATPQDHSQQVSTGQEDKRYELFAIWHHMGSYGSGHYYAEIKSDSDDWYNFNDENVEQKMDINLSSRTAYMLMYRLIDTNPKAELPAGLSKKPVDESEKGKPVLSWVMRMLGWVMRMLGWVMRKLKLGWVMLVKGENCAPPVEGEVAASPVEGENCSPPVEGEDCAPPVEGEDCAPPVEEENCSPPVEGEDCAPPVEGEVAASPVEGENCAPPVEGENCSPPVEGENCAPPVEGEDCAPPVEGENCSPPVEGENCAPPVEGEVAAPPVEGEVAASPVEGEDCAPPVEGENCAPPVEGENCASPVEGENCSPPVEGENCSPPVEGENCSSPVEGENCSPPVEGENCASPVEGENCSPPVEGENCSPPVEGENCAPPVEGENCAPLVEGEVAASPVEGENCSPPVEGEVAAPPVEGENCAPPVEGENCAPPVEAEDCAPPVEGEVAASPVEGENCAPPVEGEVAASPVEGEVGSPPVEGETARHLAGQRF